MFETILERMAFEPFAELSGVLTGAPIRVFPEGTFYRGERKLTVTKDRLQQFAANIKAGLPRFEIPINIEHKDEIGRYGTVRDLEYFETGAQGPGLYATQYELTPAGRTLLEQEKFIGLSGEAIWTLFDGAKYQDPQTGKQHDNVLVGLALTNKPFFGKAVNLYSAEAEGFRDFTTEQRKDLAKKGHALPDGSYPIPDADALHRAIVLAQSGHGNVSAAKRLIRSRAKDLGVKLPDDFDNDNDADDMAKEKMTMADENQAPPPAKEPEKFTLSADQYNALQAKAAEVDKMAAMLGDLKRARIVDQMTAHVKESFAFVPVKPEELAEKFADLQNFSADLYTYFDGLLTTLGRQVDTSELFGQKGSGLPGTQSVESFSDVIEAVLTEKFGGDRTKYTEAMHIARAKNPALAAKYESTYSQRPSKTQARAQE